MFRLLLILCLTACLTSFSAFAAKKLTVESGSKQISVVELYTSEGCSSCPPADKWFEALIDTPKQKADILALAFHVDYWDYIGWKDRFADPKHTTRQRQLGANNYQRSIYTPEFFVNGKEARGTRSVLSKISDGRNKTSSVNLKLSVSKNQHSFMVELETTPTKSSTRNLHHRYFIYESGLTTEVTRGENAGETMDHQQVVRYMSAAFESKANDRHSIKIDPDWKLDQIGIAALVTTPDNDQYIQAIYTPITSLLD